MVLYENKNVIFECPDSWSVTEDDFDEAVRSITVGSQDEEFCTIDIYTNEQAPSLLDYGTNSNIYFEKKLPFLSKIIHWEKPEPVSLVGGIEGIMFGFSTKTFFFLESTYQVMYFSIQSKTETSLFCAQFESEERENRLKNLKILLESYVGG